MFLGVAIRGAEDRAALWTGEWFDAMKRNTKGPYELLRGNDAITVHPLERSRTVLLIDRNARIA